MEQVESPPPTISAFSIPVAFPPRRIDHGAVVTTTRRFAPAIALGLSVLAPYATMCGDDTQDPSSVPTTTILTPGHEPSDTSWWKSQFPVPEKVSARLEEARKLMR